MNLTAEQVRETVLKRGNVMGPRFYGDWQAIADELNLNGTVNGTANGTPTGHVTMDDGTVPIAATLGCGECRNTWDVELTERLRFQCSECGAVSLEITPSYCPACERKAVKR